MASCLGISTESNLIKYAKVSKERENYNIDSYGVKFFDNLEDAIRQIVEETQSVNIPININLTDEMYNKFEVFSGLKKKDIEKILSSEFELLCSDKNYNFQALISRYILSEIPLEKDKTGALYISADKTDIAGKIQKVGKYKVNSLVPIPVALYNLLDSKKENTAIVNIEDKTTITLVVGGQIVEVKVLETGMKQILEKISRKENSYARAYEACKNTTIYTMDLTDNEVTANEYLEDIMPILYDIVMQTKEMLDNNFISMQKILLTGTATAINNLELYFQEYFPGAKCEILTPSFANKNMQSGNIKEYIEVNSAIALARQGLGEGVQGIEFKNVYSTGNWVEEIKRIATSDVKIDFKNIQFDFSLKGSLDRVEKDMLRVIRMFVLIILIFAVISIVLTNAIIKKIDDVNLVIEDTNSVIAQINSDTTTTKNKISDYSDRIQKLEALNNQIKTNLKLKRAIPNLLSQIMSVIPRGVQLTSIENIGEKQIVIKAQAEKYEELGYFGAVLKNQGILLDVTTSTGTKENNVVKIEIKGNLP